MAVRIWEDSSMKRVLGLRFCMGTALMGVSALQAADNANPNYPAWAYGVPPRRTAGHSARTSGPRRWNDAERSRLREQFTLNQIRGRRDNDTPARDWPADGSRAIIPRCPRSSTNGDEGRGIIACSLCHYPNGKGRSENASPAGLPKEYIERQLHNMKNDQRASAERRKANTQAMVTFAKAMTEEEIQQAAAYFSAMKWTPWVKVVESDTAPKVRSQGGLYHSARRAQAGTEPIGNRIVEVPENPMYTETLRNPRSPFTAYVPRAQSTKGKHTRDHGRQRQDHCLHRVPWRRSERRRFGAGDCCAFAELHRAAAL
jgi:cytochrome c553